MCKLFKHEQQETHVDTINEKTNTLSWNVLIHWHHSNYNIFAESSKDPHSIWFQLVRVSSSEVNLWNITQTEALMALWSSIGTTLTVPPFGHEFGWNISAKIGCNSFCYYLMVLNWHCIDTIENWKKHAQISYPAVHEQ